MSGDPADSGGAGALVPVDEIGQLETEIADRGSGYWRGPAAETKQARYRDLLEAKAAGKTAPPSDALLAERHRIEAMIADKGSEYWRGPKSAGLQARYLALIEGRPAAGDALPEGSRASLAEVARTMPAAAEAFGGDADALGRAQDRVAGLASIIGEEAWAEENGPFLGLPSPVQSALLGELGRQSPGYVTPATAGEMTMFEASVPGGTALIQAWGGSAMRRVGAVLEAAQRIDSKLDAAQRAALKGWWDHAPIKSRMAMAFTIGNAS